MSAKRFWDHALMGARWLAEHQNPDGSWIGLDDPKMDAFYKGSWALTLTGRPAAVQRLLNYAGQLFLTEDGDFLPRQHPWHSTVHYPYANAYFIVGSIMAGRYEITAPAVRFLLSQQNTDHGGFYALRTEPGQKNRCDTMSAGAAGVACLAAGQVEAARRVADYLAHLIELQPAPNDRFFTTIEADGKLGTEPQDDAEAWWRIIDTHTENQCWYAVGLPLAFLIQLAEATGKPHHRELARWFFDFQSRCTGPWDGGSSGKGGWACAMLYRITGEPHYRDIAFHVANHIVARQNADGGWTSSAPKDSTGPSRLRNMDLDATAELTLWLALISTHVLARDET